MPKFTTDDGDDDAQTRAIPGLGTYAYSVVGVDRLGATEYTLVTIATDTSGSTHKFNDELVKMTTMAVEACKRSPRAANILVRLITFADGVHEVHGFKPLADIDTSAYEAKINSGGGTALFDATATSVGAMSDYATQLGAMDFQVNGIVFVVTDGDDNASKFSAAAVKQQIDAVRANEKMDSITSILIGVNAQDHRHYLENFRIAAGIDQYLDVANATTPGSMAKLAAFISRSVSSQASNPGASPAPVPLAI
jgi:hypothetical protein